MKLILLLTIFVANSLAFGSTSRMHSGYGSVCDARISAEFLRLYPGHDLMECHSVCVYDNEKFNEPGYALGCFAIHESRAKEVQKFINSIVLPLREQDHVEQVAELARSATNLLHFAKLLKRLAPAACSTAFGNVEKAEKEWESLKFTAKRKLASSILRKEKTYLQLTKSFHNCKMQET